MLRTGDDLQKEKAATMLCSLSANDNNKAAIGAADCIPPLVELLRGVSVSLKEKAVATLSLLSSNIDNKLLIAVTGGIPPLVKLVRNGNARQKTSAVTALWHLSANPVNQIAVAKAGGIPVLMNLSLSGNLVPKQRAVETLANVSSNAHNKAATQVAKGILTLELLTSTCNSVHVLSKTPIGRSTTEVLSTFSAAERDDNITLKEHTVYKLLDVVANEKEIPLIVSSEVIPLAVAFARDGSSYQKEKGLQVLEHVSRSDNKAAIVAAGGIPALLKTLQDGSHAQKEYATRALRNLSKSRCCQVEIKAARGEQALRLIAEQGYRPHKVVAAAALGNLTLSINPS